MKRKPLQMLIKTFSGCCLIYFFCYAANSFAYYNLTPVQFATAQVLDKAGVPCFTVQNGEKAGLVGLSVREVSENMEKELDSLGEQTMGTYQDLIPLSPPSCFLYGTQLNPSDSFFKTKKLEQGKIYRVLLGVGIGNQPKEYKAYFCLAPIKNGKTIVHQIFYNNNKNEWNIDACKPLNPTAPPPAPLVYAVKIFDKEDFPCFMVKKDDRRRVRLRSIRVYKELSTNPENEDTLVWDMPPTYFDPKENILFNTRLCLPDETQNENIKFHILKSLQPNPLYLKQNQLYRMELTLALYNDPKPEIPYNPGLNEPIYQGYFCLFSEENGKNKVHEVPYDKQKKEWDFDVCERLMEDRNEK
jgi:hypothetical protein